MSKLDVNWARLRNAPIPFKIALVASVVAHVVGFAVINSDASSHEHAIVPQPEAMPRIESVMVTEEDLKRELASLSALQEDNDVRATQAENALKASQAQSRALNKEIASDKAELKKLQAQMKKEREEIAKLKKQREQEVEALEKAKKIEAERKAKQAKAEKLAEKQRTQALEAARLQEAKEKNAAVLAQVRRDNAKREAEQSARARGVYEKGIHDALLTNWRLPYMRQRVQCSVELTLTRTGVIETYRYLNPCPDLYRRTIDSAINNTGMLPRVSASIFKTTEVVNFVDNTDSILVR